MNSTRIWTLGAVVAVVGVVGGAIGLGVQPALAAAASADATTTQVQGQNGQTQVELTRLARVAAKQSTLQQESDALLVAVPKALQLNVFSQELRDIASLDGVQISALSVAQAIPYAPPAGSPAAVAAAAAATPAPTSTPSPSASASVVPVAPVVDPGLFGKTNPLITADNFTEIPVTVTVSGDEASGVSFAADVQRTKRLFVVNTITFTKATSGGTPSSTTVSGTMYALKR